MKALGWITNRDKPGTLWQAVAGWVCVVTGVLGLVLPIIPGLPLLVTGLVLLSARYRWASDCLQWVKRQAQAVRSFRGRRSRRTELIYAADCANCRQPVETGDPSH